jgi:hypothetical protein|tara:strand:- start:404 stop:874 length:471 start_codon:yes stop_codon:yes gene_type:complete
MDGLKNNNYKIARNAHSVERKPSKVMSVESLIKRVYTMEKIKIADAKNLSKNFNLSMEQIQEKYEIIFPVVSGGKGMSVLESIKSRDKTLVELPAPLEIELSNLGTGQKLQVLKDLVASLNQSDDFKRETQIPYPLLVEGLQVEFNWKDRSKINKK